MKEVFKYIISDFWERDFSDLIERDLQVPLNSRKIITIVWPRRAWKTYFIYSLIKKLLISWVNKKNIVFINFEDERIDIKWSQLWILLDAYLELYSDVDRKNTYFFFDEIQNIIWWEKFVRRIYDQWIKNIFITWSNSKLLSKEIATSLRWRTLTYEILPLSFNEFLRFKKLENIDFYTTRWKAKILNLQREYLIWWGFPEVVNFSSDLKLKTLQNYFDVMIYNDIIERYKVKNISLLKKFIKLLIQSTTTQFSINKISGVLRSEWFKFDKNDLYDFVERFENIYFLKTVFNFDYSYAKQTKKKIYLFDNWFLTSLTFKFTSDWGKLLENAVFVWLYRKFWDKIYFLKNWNEVDFVINLKDKLLYQVCYKLDGNNFEREIWWCIFGMEKFGINRCYIITFEQEDEIKVSQGVIKLLPFYKLTKLI